jgi:hypothetical protein
MQPLLEYPDPAEARAHGGNWGCCRTFPNMGHYRIYQLDPSDHITAGFSVECGSDAAALRTAQTLLERSTGVEVWKSDKRLAHLSPESRLLWDQRRKGWLAVC